MILKIKEEIYNIESQYGTTIGTFYWFDDPIIEPGMVINRVNRNCPYALNETFPSNWYTIKGNNLIKMYNQLKNCEFYIYRNVSCDYSPYKRMVKSRIKQQYVGNV